MFVKLKNAQFSLVSLYIKFNEKYSNLLGAASPVKADILTHGDPQKTEPIVVSTYRAVSLWLTKDMVEKNRVAIFHSSNLLSTWRKMRNNQYLKILFKCL